MRGTARKKVSKSLAKELRELVKVSRAANFKISWIAGRNGHCYFWGNKIEIGIDLPIYDKIIVLAHELGHVLDYTDNPPGVDEVITILKFNDIYLSGESYYLREKSAWEYAAQILNQIGAWHKVEVRFLQCKKSALASYKIRKDRAIKFGNHIPKQEEFNKAKMLVAGGKLVKQSKMG